MLEKNLTNHSRDTEEPFCPNTTWLTTVDIPNEDVIPPDILQMFHPQSSWTTKDLIFLQRYGATFSAFFSFSFYLSFSFIPLLFSNTYAFERF